MNEKFKFPKASEKDIMLYCCLGEALCAVQLLEDALSHLIVLKKTEPDEKKKADDLLKSQRFYTFGKAINISKKQSLLPKNLEDELLNILKERNWLIHESIIENKEEYGTVNFYNKLSIKTKVIASKANQMRLLLEKDLIKYCEKKGIDMTSLKNKMNKHYGVKF